jgi:hypothetical protein
VAFALSRLANGPFEPTPIGVLRAVDRAEYATVTSQQLVHAQEQRGAGDLGALLYSLPTWDVT